MRGLLSIVVMVGCAGLSLSLSIPSVNRLFDPTANNQTKFYKATNDTPPICPWHYFLYESIAESLSYPGTYVIPHTKMVADDVRCGKTGSSSEYLWLVPGIFLKDDQSAIASGFEKVYDLTKTNFRFRQVFNNLANNYKLWVGLEMADRWCGEVVSWKKDSFHILLYKNDTEFDFQKSAWISPGESAFLSYSAVKSDKERSELCVYKNSTDPGLTTKFQTGDEPVDAPLPKRTPIPSPSPFTSEPLASPSPFAFKNIVGTPKPKEVPDPEATTAVSPEATPSEELDTGKACFPSYSTVEMESGLSKRMDQVSVGDRIRVGPSDFSTVFTFTHKISDGVKREFWKLQVESGDSVSVTTGHYIAVNGALQTAESVKVGDFLTLASGEKSAVTAISVTLMEGLYNPQTQDGRIIVDGIVASTYTSAVHPVVAHGLLAPMRFLYRHGLLPEWGILHKKSYGISAFAPAGLRSC